MAAPMSSKGDGLDREMSKLDAEKQKNDFNNVETYEREIKDEREIGQLHRQMKSRHIAVIGTGLFLGTANSLRQGGPLGLWLGYSIMGTIVFAVMQALGEMISHLPVSGGHITLARRFVGEDMAFAVGWEYWYNWTIVLPAELSAAAVLVHYWTESVNDAVWITVFLVVVVGINIGGARSYAEAEFWFALIKILTIIGLIIAGLVITSGGGPDGQSIGFRYWRNPGPFAQFHDIEGSLGRFLGTWSVLIQAAFSYIGTEIVAIAAGEARNPKKSLPRAIKNVYFRIMVFYILGTFMIGLLVSPQNPSLNLAQSTAAKSPWVIAIQQAGIGGLPSLINACLLTSAWSAASSDLYTSSRALYGLALSGAAPKFFTKTTRWGLPYLTVTVGALFALLSYMNAGSATAGEVFGWFANMTSVAGLVTWQAILFTYLRFYKGTKVQGIDRKSLAYTAPLQPYMTIYAFILTWLILITNGFSVFLARPEGVGFDWATFWTSYIPIILFFILLLGFKVVKRPKMIRYEEMDFITGNREGIVEEDPVPRNWVEKMWMKIM